MLRRTVLATLSVLLLAASGGDLLAQGKGGGGGGGTTPPPDPEIVFVEKTTKNTLLRVMNADGTNVRTLVTGTAVKGDVIARPCWSPDGSRIAFVGILGVARGLWRIDTDGTDLVRIVDFPCDGYEVLDWSAGDTPGGADRIAFSRYDTPASADEVYVVNADGSGLQQLASGLVAFGGIAWSLDGQRLVVSDAMDMEVLDLGVDAGGALVVTGSTFVQFPFVNMADYPRAANTGNRVIYCLSGQGAGVGTLDFDTEPWSMALLFPRGGCQDTTFSPDDTRVAFRYDGGIYTCAADGSGEVLIRGGKGTGFCLWPNWCRN